MVDVDVPLDVQRFVRERVESYEQLEILVLLRARRSESWTASAIAAQLRMPELVAEQDLRALRQQGLLTSSTGPDALLFRYGPREPELASALEQLVGAYGEHRIEVIQLLTANALERLRVRASSAFAQALLTGKRVDREG
jgi:hypothetical protein